MAATCYCSLSVIVFKEHQSHRTLPCFDLLIGGGFHIAMLAIGELVLRFAMVYFR